MNSSVDWKLQRQIHADALAQATSPEEQELQSNYIFGCDGMLKRQARIEEAKKRMDAQLAKNEEKERARIEEARKRMDARLAKNEEKERARIEEARKRMDARLAQIEREREARRQLESEALMMTQLRFAPERNCRTQPGKRGDEWFFAGVRAVAGLF
jgi:hypothetical protein